MLTSIILTFFVSLQTVLVIGQLELEVPESNSTTISPTTISQEPSLSSIEFKICNPTDNLSKTYCNCDNGVINCDFSNYPKMFNQTFYNGDKTNSSVVASEVELILFGYTFPSSASRFCICNTPNFVHLTFSKENFLPFGNKIQRFDLFNLRGKTNFDGGFSQNFQGDLCIKNVSLIPEVKAHEFGTGNDKPVEDVEHLKCCSTINVNQGYLKPVLLMENIQIDYVHPFGINYVHLWKAFILKSVHVNNVENNGIVLDHSSGHNVAILKTIFSNVSQFGVVFKDFSNLVMVKSYFKWSTNSLSLFARTNQNNSNILLIGNKFWNKIIIDMEAENIVSWSNLYDVWDNDTFLEFRYTNFPNGGKNRSVSFKYNNVNTVNLTASSLDFENSTISITDNVLGSCNCFLLHEITDQNINHELNYCYTGKVGMEENITGKCSVRLDAAVDECSKQSESADFASICQNKKVAVSGFPRIGETLKKEIDETLIRSNFVHFIVQDYGKGLGKNKLQIGKIVVPEDLDQKDRKGSQHQDGHKDLPTADSGSGNKSKSGSGKPVSTFVWILVIVFVVGTGVLSYKYRNKFHFIRRRGVHEVLQDESQNTFI